MKRMLLFVVGFALLAVTAPAFAGLADPVPTLAGLPAIHVYSFAGVTKASNLETAVICSSTEKTASTTVGLQVFDKNGFSLNDVSGGTPPNNGVVTMGPGGSVVIATGTIAALSLDAIISGMPVLASGAGRILSTSKKIVCTAIVLDRVNTPPTSMTNLQVFSKLKQHGD